MAGFILPSLDPETQGAVDRYARKGIVAGDEWPGQPKMPEPPQKRRGLFGGKLDMEDFQMSLARAAAYFQGDYEGAAAITGEMSKAKRNKLDAAQIATALAADGSIPPELRPIFEMDPPSYLKWKMEQAKPQELPSDVRTSEWRRLATPEQRAAYDELHSQLTALTENGSLARTPPGGKPEMVVLPNPGDKPPGSPVTGAPITVSTQKQYDDLEPGTPYIDAQGNHGVKQGGPTPRASGNFPRR